MMEEWMYWFWFSEAAGIGRNVKHKMLEYFITPRNIFYAKEDELIDFCKKEVFRNRFIASRKEDEVFEKCNQLHKKGIRFLSMEEKDYPERLKVIPDPPIGLYLKGKLPEETKKTIAIIGARECTRYGSEMARFFGRELGSAGLQVISGLARGIDGMAHLGALESDSYTLGVLGCGIDVVYPEENFELFLKLERYGGILSESGLGVKPYAGLFPQRNRLISGMADGILVVEAMDKSGTFITVDQGLEQGKEIFALPGRVLDEKSKGCNHLIKMGAHMVTEVCDILELLQVDFGETFSARDFKKRTTDIHKNLLAPNEKIVYSCLRVEPQYLDAIIKEAQVSPQEVCMILNRFVLKGIVVETSRNYYALKL